MRTQLPLLSLVILASATATARAAAPAGITGILNGTPWWVYAVFTVLTWSGLQAVKPRSWPLARIALIPLVFATWGVASLLLAPGLGISLIVTWLATAGFGAWLALITLRSDRIGIDRATRRIGLPGSWVPLARNLSIFAAKYAIAVAGALDPAMRSQLAFWDIALSSLAAGYFLGWLARLAAIYYARPIAALPDARGGSSAAFDRAQERAPQLYRQFDTMTAAQERITQMFRHDVSLFDRSFP